MSADTKSFARTRRLAPRLAATAVVPARSVRRWVHGRQQRRMLDTEYPVVSRSLNLDPSWRVHRIASTVGDVTVALVGGPAPEAVLKWARSARGTAALQRSGDVVDTLTSDDRLRDWTDLLPRRLRTARTTSGHLVVLEQLLPGEVCSTTLTADTQDRLVALVLDSVRNLHERTASRRTIDQSMLREWVDEPVAILAGWYDAKGLSRTEALEGVRGELHQGLLGREARVGWIHGDLAPGNVLLRGGLRVSGLLDWERAKEVGLPEVDEIHLRLTARMHTERREFGDLVCDWLGGPESAATDSTLVLLCWLHHVSGILAKSNRYRTWGLWAARNVEPVLRRREVPNTRPGPRVRITGVGG